MKLCASLFVAVLIISLPAKANNSSTVNIFEDITYESQVSSGNAQHNGRCSRNVFKTMFGTIYQRNCGCKKCSKPKIVKQEAPKAPVKTYKSRIANMDLNQIEKAYQYIHRECADFAPINFEYVDFRIAKQNAFDEFKSKLGNYRFRIFGCRRYDKSAYLNIGRTMQKDMKFFNVFNDLYGSCIPQQKMPADLCDENSDAPLPEYILTAEITDYFMNICDEYNWAKAKKNDKRNGSSEMTITWRLLDLTKNIEYWKGQSTGYAEVEDGEENGELLLIERAFADAASHLRNLDGFEAQLATRQNDKERFLQRKALAELEKKIYPFKCQYTDVVEEVEAIAENGGTCNCPSCSCPTCQACTMEEIVEEPKIEGSEIVSIIEGDEVIDSAAIDETSGTLASGKREILGNNVNFSDDAWIEIPLEDEGNEKAEEARKIVEEAFSKSAGKFCIENALTFKEMNAQNLYKVRASIVNISNSGGKIGSGLIISDQFILTSADLVTRNDNNFNVKTINGKEMKASAFRVSPNKNVALLLLQDRTEFTPLPLNLELPQIGQAFLTLGNFDLSGESEGWVEDESRVKGYRYSPTVGTEIIMDSFTQGQTVGGALVDMQGNIYGLAHSGKRLDNSPDLFIPIEAALKSLDVELCGRAFLNQEIPQESEEMKAIDQPVEKTEQQIDAQEIK